MGLPRFCKLLQVVPQEHFSAGHRVGETDIELPRELVSGPQRGAGLGWGQPEAKRVRLSTTDHQVMDLRTLLEGNRINPDQATLPHEGSPKKLCTVAGTYLGMIQVMYGAHGIHRPMVALLFVLFITETTGGCG